MLIPLLAVLAQTASLPDPQSSASIGWLLAGIGGLCLTINQIMGIVENFRKLRGGDSQAQANNERFRALENDLRETELRLERRIGEHLGSINTRLGNLEGTLTNLVADFSRSLGNLEGRADADKH